MAVPNQDELDFLKSMKRASIQTNCQPRISALRVFLISLTWKTIGEVISSTSFRESTFPGFVSLCPWCSGTPQAQGSVRHLRSFSGHTKTSVPGHQAPKDSEVIQKMNSHFWQSVRQVCISMCVTGKNFNRHQK